MTVRGSVEDHRVTTLSDAIDQAYGTFGETPELLPAIDRVLETHDADAPRAAFERAGARDALGMEADAIPLYRVALAQGLGEPQRLQCLIQLGSSLRNVGHAEEALRVLRAAREEAQGESRDWVDAFLALALHSDGQRSQALAVALKALAPHLTMYGRAVSSYADELR